MWPESNRCVVERESFPKDDQNLEHSYTGSTYEKNGVEAFAIDFASELEYIPDNLFEEFPKLVGLTFWDSPLPTIKEGFFNEKFKGIRNIYIGRCSVSVIKENAFSKLPKLEWLNVENNKITNLDSIIFQSNPKLKFVSFYKNDIASINPKFFSHLKNLVEVRFSLDVGDCGDSEYGCAGCYGVASSWQDEQCIFTHNGGYGMVMMSGAKQFGISFVPLIFGITLSLTLN
jgi:hypothetical protein